MAGEERHAQREARECGPATAQARVRPHHAGEDCGQPHHPVDHRPVSHVGEHEAGEHEGDAAHGGGEASHRELPRVEIRESTRHCVVQEMVILQDDVRDLLPALEEAQHEQIDRIKEMQMRLQEHRMVRAAAQERRARSERRVPERQDAALQQVVEVRLNRETEITAQIESRARERGHDRPELHGRQHGEGRDRQSLTHPWTEPAHSGRERSQSARVA